MPDSDSDSEKKKDDGGSSGINTALKVLLGIGVVCVFYFIATAVTESCVDENGKETQSATCSMARLVTNVGDFVAAVVDNMGAIIGAAFAAIIGATAVGIAKYTGGGGGGSSHGQLGGDGPDGSEHRNPDDNDPDKKKQTNDKQTDGGDGKHHRPGKK